MTAACPACVALPPPQEIAASAATKVVLSVPEVHCASCIQGIERVLKGIPGVHEARVNLTLRRVNVATDVPPQKLVDALAQAGYKAYPFADADLDGQTDKTARDLILRLGVAGFAMMNVMLLSVAVWSGAPAATRDLFHLISAAIALPATVYAAQPFFRSAVVALRGKRLNMDVPISLAIILAGGMSLFEALNGGEHAYFDAALSLTFFLLIGRVLEHRSRSVARSAAKELAAMEVQSASRKRDGAVETVPLSELAVGDILLVPTGVRVAVDGVLTSAQAFCDRSFLTGESDPVIHSAKAELKAGEINVGPAFEMRAVALGEDTALRKIAALLETAENGRNRYTSLADRAARIYAPAVHLLAGFTFLGWWMATGDVRHALNVAIAVLIITCPCALGLAVPAVTTAAIGKLYELGFLVKSGTALERLAEVKTIVFDKTGTLTRAGFALDLATLSESSKQVAKALAQASAHPMSKALCANLASISPANVTDIKEYPGRGVEGCYKGKQVRLGHANWVGLEGGDLSLKIGDKMIPLPSRETAISGAADAQTALHALDLELQIVSGDRADRTEALAKSLDIPTWRANVTPDEKHAYIETLNAIKPTCMVGDGINDAAALAAAHASIAPGTALDAARNAADVVMIKDTLADLPKLIAISRKAASLSRQNFAIAGLYNCIAVPFAMAGFATPLLAALAMSASSITVILNALRVRRVS